MQYNSATPENKSQVYLKPTASFKIPPKRGPRIPPAAKDVL